MSANKNRTDAVKFWWGESNACMESARREIDAGSYRYAVNRLYYALFYSISAALMEKGYAYKKHSGVKSAFHREFVKTGLVKKESGILYDRLFEDRHEGDYIVMTEFTDEYTEKLYTRCLQFLSEIQKNITSI